MQYVTVKVSVRSAWQRFHGCAPDFIRDVCHGQCCDAPSRPTGTLITIHLSEQAAIEARGGVVEQGLLASPERRCPFKTEEHLCSLHETGDKPFGCVASPFTLTKADTLIVRNRYRLFKCYARQGSPKAEVWQPAFQAFRASLDLLFGPQEARRLCRVLEEWGDPHTAGYDGPQSLVCGMPVRSYRILKVNDEIKAQKSLQVEAGRGKISP